MQHSFNVNVAKKVGVNSAILLNHFYFWIAKNRADNLNFYDNHYWTFISKKALCDLFPYMTLSQIEYAIKKLIESGYLITGNYNKSTYDRTLWYAITNNGYSILEYSEMDLGNFRNGERNITEPIPYISNNIYNSNYNNTNYNKELKETIIINNNSKENKESFSENTTKTKTKRFTKPTLEEVEQYCSERKNSIDAQTFIDYYESKGWLVGKTPMKDWKAAIRNWERRKDNNTTTTNKSTYVSPYQYNEEF